MCQVDVYEGLLNNIVTNAGKNFISTEFRQLAGTMLIKVTAVLVEAHNSIRKVERYYSPIRRAFKILKAEMPGTDDNVILQIAFKAINDTAGPNGIVPTLLVFGAYLRITKDLLLSLLITQRAEAIYKATKEIRSMYAKRQVDDARAMRNSLNTLVTMLLLLQLDVRVQRKKEKQTSLFKLIANNSYTCVVDMLYSPTLFRVTVVKPYFYDNNFDYSVIPNANNETKQVKDNSDDRDNVFQPVGDEEPVVRRRRGRLPGLKNKPKVVQVAQPQVNIAFLLAKEKSDIDLSIKLRSEGIITTDRAPFNASTKQEIDSLIARGVFSFEQFNASKHSSKRVFKLRIVKEVKGKNTLLFEKSRLVIQAYNDIGKEVILTQSPTI